MRALITGGTGFVGLRLAKDLRYPFVLSRDSDRARSALGRDAEVFAWRPEEEPAPAAAFEDVDAVFHLAGESIAGGRWDAERKARIQSSRILGTRNLVRAIAELEHPPRVLVSASAVGFYGDRGDTLIDEQATPGTGFLPELCKDWEAEALRAAELGVRVVLLRFGVVLGREGGALQRMLVPFQLGLGTRLGDGRQWMPWIELTDLIEIMKFVASENEITGPINAVAPNPVTNAEFTRALAAQLRRPAFWRAPAALLHLLLGEMAGELLASQRVVPRAVEQAGFQYLYPRIEQALSAALGRRQVGQWTADQARRSDDRA